MSQPYRFQLLAPRQTPLTKVFRRFDADERLYAMRLSAIQKLRGEMYLENGVVRKGEVDRQGRFTMAGDTKSWHVALLDKEDNVKGCCRYIVHPRPVPFEQLGISQSALARHPYWKYKIRIALNRYLHIAGEQGLPYMEGGGWALSNEWRGTQAALELLVASYALGQLWGGCLGYFFATLRTGVSSVLRRIGGESLTLGSEEFPAYEDPRYGCMMEVLKFDSRTPVPRLAPLIDRLQANLGECTVVRAARN